MIKIRARRLILRMMNLSKPRLHPDPNTQAGRLILLFLRHNAPLDSEAISVMMTISRPQARSIMQTLCGAGVLTRVGPGVYRLSEELR
jgi:DNA-binding IscR family transcriptional regulator